MTSGAFQDTEKALFTWFSQEDVLMEKGRHFNTYQSMVTTVRSLHLGAGSNSLKVVMGYANWLSPVESYQQLHHK